MQLSKNQMSYFESPINGMFSVYYAALLIPAVIGEANSYTHNMVYTAVPNSTVQQNHLGKGDGESSSP